MTNTNPGARRRVAVLDVVGLSARLVNRDEAPRIRDFVGRHALAVVRPAFPAVTCTAQASYLTGLSPAGHGVVANGWFHRELAEHHFWKQSNHLVHGPRLWEILREREGADFTCAKLFWWFNMYSSADVSITPRPIYCSDGRKVFDIYSEPPAIRPDIKADLGDFPFPAFWGPGAGIDSSRWIAASARWIEERHSPDLSLVYLPHLDYDLQRAGSAAESRALAEIDAVVGELLDFYEGRGVDVVLVSEYGITDVDRPVHLNRLFRERGWFRVRDELGRETADLGASRAFAVADHQVAHVYVAERSLRDEVRRAVEAVEGVAAVLDDDGRRAMGIDHPRSGDLVAVAEPRSWFTYQYWLDDEVAPDFARCVDIHRKIGYDPAELFIDPALRWPKLRIANRLLRKKLGMRMLMDVVPLDASLVRGSHGRIPDDPADHPILAGPFARLPDGIESTDVFARLASLWGTR